LDGTTLYILIVVFAATLIRSVFGFGEALVAVPLLALRIPVNVAAPLAVLVSITVAGVIVAQDWRKIHVRSTGWLLLPTLLGIPLGLLLLTSGNQRLVKGTLAVLIIAFSAYALIGRRPPELQGYFLPASVIGMGGYWLAGLWVPAVTRYYLMSLPITLAAVLLGRVINRRLHGHGFLKYVHIGLVAIGAVLLFQAIRR
jgi:uncharacterized protein